MPDFLICFHLQANSGYAIEPLEILFFDIATQITGSESHVHLGYKGYDNGVPRWFKGKTDRLIKLRYMDTKESELSELTTHIKRNNIKYVLAFDLPVGARIIKAFRKGGVRKIISYWGAPMSSINNGIKLFMKRLQVWATFNKPNHFIFESYGMQRMATNGRGVKQSDSSVVRLGIDTDRYSSSTDTAYVNRTLNIPEHRKIIFYAGHMEKRKGVDIIIKAATLLVNERGHNDIHVLICGNRPGEEQAFYNLYRGTTAERHITFGGYRDDIPELIAGCYAAVIASTGWDSFPRSSLEMAAAGLPLLVSDLAGLNETIEQGVTGLLFKPGDHIDLADKLEILINDLQQREEFSRKSIERVHTYFTEDVQRINLLHVIKHVIEIQT